MDEKRRMILVHIGGRVRKYRRESGMSRDEIAILLNISPRTLAAYERGEREMSLETASELAKIFKTTLTKLTDYGYITGMML